MSNTVEVKSLDGWNPRTFSETVSTIVLANTLHPRCGEEGIHFSDLRKVNSRWDRCPKAGLACLKMVDLAKVNTALTILGSLQVLSVAENGNLNVRWNKV